MSTVLTMTELQELIAGGRTTTYKPTIINFVKNDELYLDVMTIHPFSEKKIDSVYNSFNNNLKLLKSENPQWPHIEVRKTNNGMVLLLNVTKMQGETEGDTTEED